jgi:hypothetical protein
MGDTNVISSIIVVLEGKKWEQLIVNQLQILVSYVPGLVARAERVGKAHGQRKEVH